MDRFFTISFPLKYGRNKTRKLMLTKITIVWIISISISSPLFFLGYFDSTSLYIDSRKECTLSHSQFKLHGSIFAFCIPFIIISTTYSFTIISLKKIIKKKEFRSSKREKKFSIISNTFYNSDNRSSLGSIQNFEIKRKISNVLLPMPKIDSINDASMNPSELKNTIFFNEYGKIKQDFESYLFLNAPKVKRSKSLNNLEDKIKSNKCSRFNSIDRLHKSSWDQIIGDKSRSKDSESIPSVLMLRKNSKHHLRPLEKIIYRIESEMDRLLSNYSKNDISAISQIPSSFLSVYTPNELKSSRTINENKVRKNSIVTFCSNSFYEKNNSILDMKARKQSKNKIMNQVGDLISNNDTRKKSIFYSADLIIRSNSLFSGSQSMKCKMKQMKIYNKQNNEGKALKVLMIIFFMFVLFWSPFFVVNILSALCNTCKLVTNKYLIVSITWLGYSSSMVNPVVYTMFNKSFRRAFFNLLKCQTKKYNELKRQKNIIFRNFHYSSTRNSKLFV